MKRAHFDTATPYIASYVLVTDKNGHIAFVLRANTPWMNGFYGLPSGKVENNETFMQGAIREAKEEVGVTIKPEKLKYLMAIHRKGDDSEWVDVYFEALKWEGEPYNAEPHMHSELAWLDPKNLLANVIPSVKFALEQIVAGHNYAEYGWKNR